MKALVPIDLDDLLKELEAEGKSRCVLWQDSESLAFLSSGRRDRKDFHRDPSDEVTLQLKGTQRLVYITAEGERREAVIKPGQILLCPAGVAHSPRVDAGSWFIVFERKRRPGEKDQFLWFCDRCGEKVYEVSVEVGDYRKDPVARVHERFYGDAALRTCQRCGFVIPSPGDRRE